MNKTDSISNLKQLIERSALKFSDKIALQIKRDSGWTRYSFQDIWERLGNIGGQLRSLGINKGDRVAIISENCPEWGIAYLSIVSAGITAVPIDCKLSKETILHLAEYAGVKAVFAAKKLTKLFEEKKSLLVFNLEKIGLPLEDIRLTPHNPPIKELPEVGILKEDVASIIFTSGTTGTPKGVMLTHYNFISDAIASLQGLPPLSPADNILSIIPLHHVFEFTAGFLVPLYVGATITYLKSLQSEKILENMLETKTTAIAAVPVLYEIFHQRIVDKIQELPGGMQRLLGAFVKINRWIRFISGKDLGKVFFSKIHKGFGGKIRFFVSGGAKLSVKVTRFFQDIGFNLLEGYGITEASPIISVNSIEGNKIGSVGRPLPGIQVKIDRPDHAGIGEIKIKGPNVMLGYFKNDKATHEVIRGGWFHTGDLGYLDKEGYLYITGRKKDLIVTPAGKNVYPDDVEAYYSKIPGISELCAFGCTSDEGEAVFAAIIPDEKYFTGKKAEEIKAEIEKRLQERSKNIPSYERIRSFVIWDGEFPKTSLKKNKRFKIKEDCATYFPNNKGERRV